MSNVGEIDEPKIIEKLVNMRGEVIPCLGLIKSVVDYSGREYPNGIQAKDIKKAPGNAKRDVTINGSGYSLKSTRAAPPAIVNHTTREKWMRVCSKLGLDILPLDDMVREYWHLRIRGMFGEDVPVSNPLCPFGKNESQIRYLEQIITYFLFDGSGAYDSPYPADFILGINNPNFPNTWRVLNRFEAFSTLWPKLVFSIRAKKGMPKYYPNMRNHQKKRLIEPWVKYIDGDYRGALHVRSRR